MTKRVPAKVTPDRTDLRWLDRMKALALLWVILDHIVERAVGGAAAGNLSDPWSPLRERFLQLLPVPGSGAVGSALAVLRDFAWFGDQGVTVLFLLSGFGLAFGAAGAPLDVRWHFSRRVARIYPTWWGAHLLFWPTGFLIASGLSSGDWRFYASFLGFRAVPALFYYFAPAWWYVGTLLQLYLVFPLLYRFALARGWREFVVVSCTIGFIALGLGPGLIHGNYLDLWQRGAIFITRLPEFGLGIALGLAWRARGAEIARTVRSPGVLAAGAFVYAIATLLSCFVIGEIIAPVLLGATASIAIFALSWRKSDADIAPAQARRGTLAFLGRHSYAIYLVHHPFVNWLVGTAPDVSAHTAIRFALGAAGALVATAIAAFVLERGTEWGVRLFARLRARRGLAIAASAFASGFALVVFIVPVAADVAIAKTSPEEVLGWGERPSLEPDAVVGWKMRPSATTHLRWVTYDYTVSSNALGFPGPDVSPAKPPGTLRVLVTGDAFSSAEGVDTPASWPRALQGDLSHDLHRPVQVLNFAITGYGPEQEAAVVKTYAPQFKPDVVLVEMFANDVGDALLTNDEFRQSIGFQNPDPQGLESIFSFEQLRASIAMRVVQPSIAKLRHHPSQEAVQLGNLAYVDAGPEPFDGEGVARSIASYRTIAAGAREAGAMPFVAFVPPPVAVCDASSLRYLPSSFEAGSDRYDLRLPIRRAERITTASNIPLFDLTADLRAMRPCPYVAHNMHFSADAHAAVASDLARRLEAVLKR